MKTITTKLAIALALTTAACAQDVNGVGGEEDMELSAERQEFVNSINGLKVVNGLRTNNGLKSVNGLSTINGLKVVNGFTTINGLKTFNGLPTRNGLAIDCAGKTLGVDCSGDPDGLLSAATGMMSSDSGIETAKYMVRCALPATDSIRIKDYTGGLVTLSGELGLSPGWATGQCDQTCQEQISACLMAFTNGSGQHVAIEMSSQNAAVGSGNSYRYQEAVFYGNFFLDTPKAYYCAGKDFDGLNVVGINLLAVDQRACSGYTALFGNSGCPYVNTGACNYQLLDLLQLSSNKCTFSNKAASKCAPSGSTSKTWLNPMTTYRQSKS
jgi:hypothetical protein